MKPWIHAKSSAIKFGGVPKDYLPIHDFMDSSKSAHADVRHRCVLHSAFGIYIVEKVFGTNITNSKGKDVSVRDIAEQHVLEDLGTIPSLGDWLKEMKLETWMGGPKIRKEVISMKPDGKDEVTYEVDVSKSPLSRNKRYPWPLSD